MNQLLIRCLVSSALLDQKTSLLGGAFLIRDRCRAAMQEAIETAFVHQAFRVGLGIRSLHRENLCCSECASSW